MNSLLMYRVRLSNFRNEMIKSPETLLEASDSDAARRGAQESERGLLSLMIPE